MKRSKSGGVTITRNTSISYRHAAMIGFEDPESFHPETIEFKRGRIGQIIQTVKVEEYEKLHKQYSDAYDEIDILWDDYRKLSSQLARMQKQNEERDASIASLESQLNELQSQLDEANRDLYREREQARKRLQERDASIASVESQLNELQSQLDEANRGYDRRLGVRKGVMDAELDDRFAEERASFESGLKEFQALDEGMREVLREEAIKSRREITFALDETIRGIESVRDGILQSFSDYLQELYLHDFNGLAIFIQYYFKTLSHLSDVSANEPENSELTKTLAQFKALQVTLENACGEMGLTFVWANPGEPFKAGTEHDLLDENAVPTGIESTEFLVHKCVAPGITHRLRGGKEKTIRRPIVTVIEDGQDE